jgi:hypothetical protein
MNLKFKIYLFLLSVVCVFTSCLKEKYVPAPPQLKIIVNDIQMKKVEGATVKLFSKETDFENESNVVDFGLTDSLGTIVFIELEESIYFFKIEKGGQNNLESNYTFKEPLQKGERKVIVTSVM